MKKSGSALFTREVAESYDTFYTTEMGKRVDILEKRMIGELDSRIPRCPLLEIGCGTGHWTEYFRAGGFSVTATDASEAMIEVARRRSPAGSVYLRAEAERLPFDVESFPAAAAVTVFEFLEDPARAVREIRRVLRPGGFFIGGFLNAESELAKKRDADPVIRHGRLFTEGEILELLAPLGDLRALRRCIHFSPSMEILDGLPAAANHPPAFIAVLVQKGV